MRFLKIISLCIILSLGFNSCKNDSRLIEAVAKEETVQVVDDKMIYEVINSLLAIKRQGEIQENHCITNIKDFFPYDALSKEDSVILKKLDTIFTQQDIDFIYRQAKHKPHFKIKKEFINGYTILLSDTVKVEHESYFEDRSKNLKHDFHKKYGNGFYTIGKPLFTKNRLYAMISIDNCCGGSCGSGVSFILKKTKSGWEIIYSYGQWIS